MVLPLVLVSTALFASFWKIISNNPWQRWSIWGSAFILFNIWFSVQVSVAINAWYVPFWDLINKCFQVEEISALYSETLVFLYIAMVAVTLAVINAFYKSLCISLAYGNE